MMITNKEHKGVKIDLERVLKKVKLNVRYLDLTVTIENLKYQQVCRDIEIY